MGSPCYEMAFPHTIPARSSSINPQKTSTENPLTFNGVIAITRHGYKCGVVSMFLLLGEKSPLLYLKIRIPKPSCFFQKTGSTKTSTRSASTKIESLLHIGIEVHWQWTATNVPEVIGYTAGRITSHLVLKLKNGQVIGHNQNSPKLFRVSGRHPT